MGLKHIVTKLMRLVHHLDFSVHVAPLFFVESKRLLIGCDTFSGPTILRVSVTFQPQRE